LSRKNTINYGFFKPYLLTKAQSLGIEKRNGKIEARSCKKKQEARKKMFRQID